MWSAKLVWKWVVAWNTGMEYHTYYVSGVKFPEKCVGFMLFWYLEFVQLAGAATMQEWQLQSFTAAKCRAGDGFASAIICFCNREVVCHS